MSTLFIGAALTFIVVFIFWGFQGSRAGQRMKASKQIERTIEHLEKVRLNNEYCTKHVLAKFPGSSHERFGHILGVHRSPTDYCDGRLHRTTTSFLSRP